ncbi:flagellin, partial [Bacillus anthracis]
LANTSTNSLKIDTLSIEGKSNQTIAITAADIAKDTNIAALTAAQGKLAALTGTPTPAALTTAVDEFKAAFEKVDKNLMSDTQIKDIKNAIKAYDGAATKTLTL